MIELSLSSFKKFPKTLALTHCRRPTPCRRPAVPPLSASDASTLAASIASRGTGSRSAFIFAGSTPASSVAVRCSSFVVRSSLRRSYSLYLSARSSLTKVLKNGSNWPIQPVQPSTGHKNGSVELAGRNLTHTLQSSSQTVPGTLVPLTTSIAAATPSPPLLHCPCPFIESSPSSLRFVSVVPSPRLRRTRLASSPSSPPRVFVLASLRLRCPLPTPSYSPRLPRPRTHLASSPSSPPRVLAALRRPVISSRRLSRPCPLRRCISVVLPIISRYRHGSGSFTNCTRISRISISNVEYTRHWP